MSTSRPAYDPIVVAPLTAAAESGLLQDRLLDDEILAFDRSQPVEPGPGFAEALEALGLVRDEKTIDGPNGAIDLTIIRPATRTHRAPVLYTIHGGGMVLRNRFAGLTEHEQVNWIAELGMVLVTPEYRLAPDHPAPAGVEDCYAGLAWVVANAEELDVDPERIVVTGASGGGGLAAGTVLLARDRGLVTPLAQLLIYPQLDHRSSSVSAEQFRKAPGSGLIWPTENNEFAWNALLGAGHADREVSHYESPARASDLSGLPPSFLDVGDAEVFRDEVVAYASRLWADGVNAELHVWPGGYHGFDLVAATAPVARAARAARIDWLRRILGAN